MFCLFGCFSGVVVYSWFVLVAFVCLCLTGGGCSGWVGVGFRLLVFWFVVMGIG